MTAPGAPGEEVGVDHRRLYAYRFREVDQRTRQAAWDEITPVLERWLGDPQRVLDPAAGRGEFILASRAPERWIVDTVEHDEAFADPAVEVLTGDALEVDLPEEHFDGILVSNFLEHLSTQDDVARFLRRMHRCLRPGGRIAVVGPNFRYCAKEYFDCADHVLALTHVAVDEHLHSAGFDVERVVPRFIPYSFRSRLPASRWLVRTYLRFPPAWRVLGKQFAVIGVRPTAG